WQWVAGFWKPQDQQEVDFLPAPPDPIAEAIPASPTAQSIFVPGCWVYRQAHYLLRPGVWIGGCPGWVWIPASYVWTPAGYVFVEGHWDYPFRDRGLLFAPVFVDRRIWVQPGWFYRPSFVVYDAFLLGSLFVRLDHRSYYFGDYFDPSY